MTAVSARILGNTALDRFDALVIGSGASGGAVAAMLATHGQKVLVLEAGSNYFPDIDKPSAIEWRSVRGSASGSGPIW